MTFRGSITHYIHSIAWALHSKATAKAERNNKALIGNVIDAAVRNTQDQQTLGIPVGPDTSDLISELLGVALDLELLNANPNLNGVRFVDDYFLYYATRSEAESALADLHRAASQFAVEINPLETVIIELPEPLQPRWKSELRFHVMGTHRERADLSDLFSSAFDNAVRYPGNNVLKFAVKQSLSQEISRDNWALYQSLLYGSLVWEPNLAPTLAPILYKYANAGYPIDSVLLSSCLSALLSTMQAFVKDLRSRERYGCMNCFRFVSPTRH